MELLEEVIQVYIERKEWFGELILQHMTLKRDLSRVIYPMFFLSNTNNKSHIEISY